MRAPRSASGGSTRRFSQVNGVSGRTSGDIRRLESERFWPGSVAAAVATYARFLRGPARVLYAEYDCPCCDPIEARDHLQDVLRMLPSAAGAELRRVVAQLDREFERRTLPDPHASLRGDRAAWGRGRLRG